MKLLVIIATFFVLISCGSDSSSSGEKDLTGFYKITSKASSDTCQVTTLEENAIDKPYFNVVKKEIAGNSYWYFYHCTTDQPSSCETTNPFITFMISNAEILYDEVNSEEKEKDKVKYCSVKRDLKKLTESDAKLFWSEEKFEGDINLTENDLCNVEFAVTNSEQLICKKLTQFQAELIPQQ
ncbi:hypothetical protein JXR93_05000 [bacterium]|nr:hypothetical protein [bacterium]